MTVRTASLIVCAGFVLFRAGAQTTSAISGVVRDPAGAVVRQARITAKQVETGLKRSGVSGADGQFVVAGLPVGAYELRAECAGFRPLVRRGIRLTVGATVTVDLDLELGALDQEVLVQADASPVNTSSSELSYLVSEQAIRELPLNGRNYTDLALLQPGVIAFADRDGGSVVAHGLGTSINGQDPRSNVYLLDGTPENDFTNGPAGSAASTVLGMETIREFRVETNAYSAEFGRNSGGQIDVLTKSGTNDFHGSVYEYVRNDALDARNFFDPRDKPDFKRNQAGATIGGPLKRDSSFFFLGYETLRDRLGKTITATVPDVNAHQGSLPDPANPGRTINVGVNQAVKPYLDEYPLPNGASLGGGLGSFSFPFLQTTDQNFGQARFDQNVTATQQFFARYTYDGAVQVLPNNFPQFPREFASHNQFVTLEHHETFSPRTLNTLRAGFSRTHIGQDVQANTRTPLQPFIAGRNLPGDIDIGNIPRFGPQSSVNLSLVQNLFSFEEGLDLTRGRHLMKAGALIEHYQDNMFNPTFSIGMFTFGALQDFLQARPQRFIGVPPNGALDRYWRFTLFGFYLQDHFRVSRRLVLNYGLRYELATMPVDIYGRDSALIHLSDPAPAVGPLYRNPAKKNFSPRLGLAWDVFGDGRTSLRAGYGLFFNTNNQQNLIPTVTNPPATPRVVIASPAFPMPNFAAGAGNSIRPIDFHIKNPNVSEWNLNLERQIGAETVVTAGYAGARGIHLWRSGDVNIPVPQRLSDGTLFFPGGTPRPNPAWSTIELRRSDGNSWYNAMIFEVRRRFAHGLSFQSSYTLSRNIDTTQSSTFFSDSTTDSTSAFPEYPGLHYNKGLSDYQAKHNWVANATWALPLARSARGSEAFLLKGWELMGISTVRSGNPLTVFESANRSRSLWAPSLGPGIGVERPSLAPGRTYESAVLGGPDRYFDPAAFVEQPAGQFGTEGRGALIGPNLRVLDVAAVKNAPWTRLGENGNVQVRAEFFNLLNRANFGPPSLIVFNGAANNEAPQAGFGRITTTVTSSRQIQFGVRVRF